MIVGVDERSAYGARGKGQIVGLVSVLARSSNLTAITVMKVGADYRLCPFFGKCDGLLIVEPASAPVAFIPNTDHDPASLSRLIIESKIRRLICGFVPQAECQKMLLQAGIDVRLASGAYAIPDLIFDFANLPEVHDLAARWAHQTVQ